MEGPGILEIQKTKVMLYNNLLTVTSFSMEHQGPSSSLKWVKGLFCRWWVDRLNVCWVWVHYMDKSKKKIKIIWNATHFLVNILFSFFFLFPLMHFKSFIQWSLKCLLMWWLRKTPHICGIPAKKAKPGRGNIRLTQTENQSVRLLVQTHQKCQCHKMKKTVKD